MTLYYRRKRIKIILISIILLLITTAAFSILKVRPVFIMLSQSKTQTMTLKIISEIAKTKISELEDTLVTYQKNEAGDINAVNANMPAINKLANEITSEITNTFATTDKLYIYIPLGSVFGNELFSASGPKIPVEIIPVGEIKVEFKTEFASAGINQTRHKIYLNIICKMGIIAPLARNTIEVTLEIPISETVIVGEVPQSYYQFDGIDKNDTLNLIN